MEIKLKKTFIQNSSYDSTLENVESKVKPVIKVIKFKEMVERLGEDKIQRITAL
jgi:hypothetical protein